MVKNLSYNSKKIKILLTEVVGRPLSLTERFKLRGIGSNKLVITDASKEIVELTVFTKEETENSEGCLTLTVKHCFTLGNSNNAMHKSYIPELRFSKDVFELNCFCVFVF